MRTAANDALSGIVTSSRSTWQSSIMLNFIEEQQNSAVSIAKEYVRKFTSWPLDGVTFYYGNYFESAEN